MTNGSRWTGLRTYLFTAVELLVDPVSGFTSLLRSNRFWIPALLWVSTMAAGFGFWALKADPEETARGQLESLSFYQKLEPEQQTELLQRSIRSFVRIHVLSAMATTSVLFVAVAFSLLMVFRAFMDADIEFKQALTVVAWSLFLRDLVRMSLSLVTLTLKGDWNVPLLGALQTDLSAWSRLAGDPVLRSLASSLDLLTAWALFLMSAGFAVAAGQKTSFGARGVIGAWTIFVLARVALGWLWREALSG
jgi:hypothetical protein